MVVSESEFLRPEGAVPGDVLVLTKPVGTQLAVNVWQARAGGVGGAWADRWARLTAAGFDVERAAALFDAACDSMGALNRGAAAALAGCSAHGATDVTGFGLLGHADNMAIHSAAPVRFVLSTVPVFAGALAADDALGGFFKLRAGLSAETSGGLLIALPPASVPTYLAAMAAGGGRAWVVGEVVSRPDGSAVNDAVFAANVQYLEV